MSNIVVKSSYLADVRRLANVSSGKYDNLLQTIRSVYGIDSPIVLKYEDEEKELITMATENDWQEALIIAKENGLKTIKVYVYTNNEVSAPIRAISAASIASSTPSVPVSTTPSVTVEDVTKEELKAEKFASVDEKKPEGLNSPPPAATVESSTEDSRPVDAQVLDLLMNLLGDNEFKAKLLPTVNKLFERLAQAQTITLNELVELLRSQLAKLFDAPLVKKYLPLLTSRQECVEKINGGLAKIQQFLVQGGLIPQIQIMVNMFFPVILARLESIDIAAIVNSIKQKVEQSKAQANGCCGADFHSIFSELAGTADFANFAPFLAPFLGSAGFSGCPFSSQQQTQGECPVKEEAKVDPNSHPGVMCDGKNCGMNPIIGIRYKCTVCDNFDLCSKCESSNQHDPSHPLVKLQPPAVYLQSEEKSEKSNVHTNVSCDGPNCGMSPIVGIRYKCSVCHNTDFCAACEAKGVHDATHPLLKISQPAQRRGRWGFGHGHRQHGPHNELYRILKHVGGNGGCRRSWWRRPEEQGTNSNNATTNSIPSARFIADINYPDRTVIAAGSTLMKTWSIENNGAAAWPQGTKLIFVRGNNEFVAQGEEFEVPIAQPGQTVDVSAVLNIPASFSGRGTAFFRLADKDRNAFGPRVWADLIIEKPADKPLSLAQEAKPVVQQASSPVSAEKPKAAEPAVASAPAQSPAPAASVLVSEYEAQLNALSVLGFSNRELNEYLLRQEKGNVQAVINWLLDNSRQ